MTSDQSSQQAEYVKHVLSCKCILPQYKGAEPPIFHKFVVFSTLDDKGDFVPHYVQCNSCGVVHRVTEVGVSRIMKKEDLPSLITIEDLKTTLPPKLVGILELHDCPLALWQEAQFILDNKLWGRGFTLAKELDGDMLLGKYIVILGETLYSVKSFEREDGLV